MAHAMATQVDAGVARPLYVEQTFDAGPRCLANLCKSIRAARSAWATPAARDAADRHIRKAYGAGYDVSQVRKTAMGETGGTIGGYLVPRDLSLGIFRTIGEESFLLPRASVWPMTTAILECPAPDFETAQAAGTAPWAAGIQYTWGASQAPTETEPTFRQKTLTAWDLIGYAKLSNQLVMDIGPVADAALTRLFAYGAQWQMEYAFFQGTGSGGLMPLGIVNASGSLQVDRAGSGAIAAADIANMWSSLLPYGAQRAIWACHPTAMTSIAKISTFYVNDGGGYQQEPGSYAGRLLTRPLYMTDKLPALGSTGDLVLLDPSLYLIGLRVAAEDKPDSALLTATRATIEAGEIRIDVSDQSPAVFPSNQQMWRIWLRCDGMPQLSTVVTGVNDSSTYSAYVVLNAAT